VCDKSVIPLDEEQNFVYGGSGLDTFISAGISRLFLRMVPVIVVLKGSFCIRSMSGIDVNQLSHVTVLFWLCIGVVTSRKKYSEIDSVLSSRFTFPKYGIP